MKYLTEVKHVPHGENGVSKTHSTHHKKWYLCESPYNMRLLNKYRKSRIIQND